MGLYFSNVIKALRFGRWWQEYFSVSIYFKGTVIEKEGDQKILHLVYSPTAATGRASLALAQEPKNLSWSPTCVVGIQACYPSWVESRVPIWAAGYGINPVCQNTGSGLGFGYSLMKGYTFLECSGKIRAASKITLKFKI